jgi:tetratricopeptide (TPR) repeat protein
MARKPAPPPPPRHDPKAPRPIDLFVNRSGPIGIFRETLKELPGEHASVLVFYGVGGQGKSLLCERLQRLLAQDTTLTNLAWGAVDLNGKTEREPVYLLLWIRAALADYGIKTTAFNFAYELFRKQAERSHVLPSIPNGWLEAVTDAAGDGAGEVGKAASKKGAKFLSDLIGKSIESIPFVAAVAKVIGKKVVDKGYEALLLRTNQALSEIYDSGKGAFARSAELEQALPRMLAHDVRSWRDEQPDRRIVLFIDEYESLLESGGASDLLRNTPLDDTMRELVSASAAVLFVFFSREKLRWEETDKGWGEALAGCQHLLSGLSLTDGDQFLVNAGIGDHRLRAAMVKGATGDGPDGSERTVYPIMLDFQVQLFRELDRLGKPKTAQSFLIRHGDFEAKRHLLLKRLLRNYRPELDKTLRRLAVARRFDKSLFAFIIQRFGTGLSLDDWPVLTGLSLVQGSGGGKGMFAFQGIVCETFEAFLNSEETKKTHEALFEHFASLSYAKGAHSPTRLQAAHAVEAFHHRQRADDRAALAWWDEHASRFDAPSLAASVETLHRKAVDIAQEAFGEKSKEWASRLGRLAANVAAQGKYAEAETLYRRCLTIDEALEALNGEQHLDTAASLNELANNLEAQGRYSDAEPMQRRALAIYEALQGGQHPDTATSLSNLARILDDDGRYAEAEPLHRRALAIRESSPDVGPDHFDTAVSLSGLAGNLDEQGKHRDAEPLHRRSVAIRKAACGAHDSRIVTGLNNLAANLDDQGKHAAAEKEYRRALRIRKATLGPRHPYTALSASNLGRNLDFQGKPDKAAPLHLQALATFEAVLGAGHPRTATGLNNLATNMNALGKRCQAEPLHRNALAVFEATVGPNHPSTGAGVVNLARNLDEQGKHHEAEPIFQRAIDIFSCRLGKQHAGTEWARALQARCLHALGRTKEACRTAGAAYAVLLAVHGADHYRTRNVRAFLEESCAAQRDDVS